MSGEPDPGEVTARGEKGFDMRSDHSLWSKSTGTAGETNWSSYDWKDIYAAFHGAAAADPSNLDVAAEMRRIADPQSLRNAALYLHRVQGTMVMVAKSIADQADALAGENGVWKGEAAKAFHNMMIEFSRRVDQQARTIGGDRAGVGNVPNQLWNNGEQLAWAQRELYRINIFYANEAQEAGAPVMDGNRVRISARPEIKAMMDQSMRKVASAVAGQYVITVNTVELPYLDDLQSPPPGGEGGDNDMGDFSLEDPFKDWKPPDMDNPFEDWKPPELDDPFSDWDPPSIDDPFSDWKPPDFDSAPPPDVPVDQMALNDPPPGSDLSELPPGSDVSELPPGSDLRELPPGSDVSELPPGSDVSELPPGGELPPGSDLGELPPGSGLPGGSNVPPFVGAPLPGLGLGQGQNNPNLPSRLTGNAPPNGADLGEGLPGLEPPDQFPVEAPPGSSNLPGGSQPSDWATEGGPGGAGAADNRGAGVPPMFPPPMGGMGEGANDSGGRSDASGLLGDEVEPWTGSAPPGSGDPSGFETPVSNPEEWASNDVSRGAGDGLGGGMPMMPPPMMPPMGGGPGDSDAGRSDASGLLGDEVDAWSGAEVPVGDPSGVNAPPVDPEEWASTGVAASDGPPPVEFLGAPVGYPSGAGREQQPVPAAESVVDTDDEESPVPTEDQEDGAGRIAVVRPPGDDEDTTAWDAVAGAGMLGFLVPLVAARADNKDRVRPEPDYALRETAPWEGDGGGEMTTYRRQKGGEVISDEWQPLMCTDAPLPEPEEEDDEPEDEGEEPRTAANLLRQSDDAWGGGGGTKPTGVLE